MKGSSLNMNNGNELKPQKYFDAKTYIKQSCMDLWAWNENSLNIVSNYEKNVYLMKCMKKV